MPAFIGTRAHAQQAAQWVDATYSGGSLSDDFRTVGEGAFRTAVLHIASSVVYKVEHNFRNSTAGYDNAAEVRNARALRKMCYADGYFSTRVRIPKVSSFRLADRLVVAMEFINGTLGYDTPDVSEDAHAELRWLGFSDMHGKNYMVEPDGTLVPVDLASARYEVEHLWPEEIEARRQAARERRRIRREQWERDHAATLERQRKEREEVDRLWEQQVKENQRRRDENKANGMCSLGCCKIETPLATWERELLQYRGTER